MFATARPVVYAIQGGFDEAAAVFGAEFDGVLVRDGGAPYRPCDQTAHQTCRAHLIRRCREIAEAHPRTAWPRHRPSSAFLFDFTLDATNWRAEQALRPAVVNRNVSGGNRSEQGAETQEILSSIVSGALMPFLLPKMHERYFFVADLMTLTLAFVDPRLWVTVPLFQVGSLLSYLPYFGLSVRAPIYALLPVTFAVSILALEYVPAHVRSSVSIRDIVLGGARAFVMQR